MSWTVDWEPPAEAQLARIWTDAIDKADVTAAADEIEEQLARNPFHLSESRDDDVRIMVNPPLAILLVWAVWRWGA